MITTWKSIISKQSNTLLFTLLLLFCLTANAQQNMVLSSEIRSLQVVANNNWLDMPVIELKSDGVVYINFDDMTHQYHRYTYRIEHCEADWSPSTDIFDSDYIDGFQDGLTIDDCQQSLNMATLYTHYTLQIPNEQCRLKMSGNYRVTVLNEEDEAVLQACFMVVEPRINVGIDVRTNTDIDFNHSHQQIDLSVNYGNINVTNPEQQIKAFVLQNNRWSTAVKAPRAQFVTNSGLKWQHCRQLIFNAGNEFRKFEYLDIHRNSLGIDRTSFDGKNYHAWIYTDEPRPNYVYDEDANGAFIIRNTDDYNNDTESEYFICHFTYAVPSPFPGKVYVNGMWTHDQLLPEYQMEYDYTAHQYHVAIPLKMGYYSYQYLIEQPDGTTAILPTEGNYYQTENKYVCLVYYRPIGGRTDYLYGYTIK